MAKKTKVVKVRAWVHVAMMDNKPIEVFTQKEKPICKHGKLLNVDCIYPCKITYEI